MEAGQAEVDGNRWLVLQSNGAAPAAVPAASSSSPAVISFGFLRQGNTYQLASAAISSTTVVCFRFLLRRLFLLFVGHFSPSFVCLCMRQGAIFGHFCAVYIFTHLLCWGGCLPIKLQAPEGQKGPPARDLHSPHPAHLLPPGPQHLVVTPLDDCTAQTCITLPNPGCVFAHPAVPLSGPIKRYSTPISYPVG